MTPDNKTVSRMTQRLCWWPKERWLAELIGQVVVMGNNIKSNNSGQYGALICTSDFRGCYEDSTLPISCKPVSLSSTTTK